MHTWHSLNLARKKRALLSQMAALCSMKNELFLSQPHERRPMTFLFSPKQQGGGKTDSGQGDAINFRKCKRTFQQTLFCKIVYGLYILMFNSGKIVQKQSCQLIQLKLEGFVCYANEAS